MSEAAECKIPVLAKASLRTLAAISKIDIVVTIMSSESEVEKRVDHLHMLARGLLLKKLSEKQISEKLRSEGIDEDYAQIIIENVKSDISEKKEFWKELGAGIFLVIGGIAINYYSFKIAENANSFFFYLFWGIVVSGIILIIRAFILFKK